MATPNRKQQSPSELRKEVVRSREYLARDVERLRDELDFPKKIRRSFQRQPGAWMVGASIAGLAVTALLLRKRKAAPSDHTGPAPKSALLRAGFMLGVLRVVINLFKPQLEAFLTQKMRRYGGDPRGK